MEITFVLEYPTETLHSPYRVGCPLVSTKTIGSSVVHLAMVLYKPPLPLQ